MEQNRNQAVYTTVIGSHMWGTATEESDVDLFCCDIMSINDLCIGKQPRVEFLKLNNVDITICEIGKVIFELKKGNYNYMLSVVSPFVISSSSIHRRLYSIVNLYRNFKPIKCIMGITNNYIQKNRDVLESNSDVHLLNKINRNIIFGIRYMDIVSMRDIFRDVESINSYEELKINYNTLKNKLNDYEVRKSICDDATKELDDILIAARMELMDDD